MFQTIRSVQQHRDLLFMITWRDIRIKYKQSIMGFMWAIFMPMIIVAAGMMIKFAFSYISKVPLVKADIIMVSVKSLPWAFFVSSIRFSSNSLTSNANLVTKIYFPRIIFPVSAVFSQLVDFLIASTVLIIILAFLGVGVSMQLFWVPVLMTILAFIAMGMGILLSAANLFFRDVKYIVEVITTFAVFFTPVFYEIEMFGKWSKLLLINPVAPVLEGLKDAVVLHQTPDLNWLAYSAVFSIIMFVVAVSSFARLEPIFAESI